MCRRPCRPRGCSSGGGPGSCGRGRSAWWCVGRRDGRRSGHRGGRRRRRAWWCDGTGGACGVVGLARRVHLRLSSRLPRAPISRRRRRTGARRKPVGGQVGVRAGVLLAAWLPSRAVPVLLLLGPYSRVGGDVSYFDASLAAAGHTGLAGTLVEYPLPAVGVLALPWLLAAASGLPYAVPLITAAAVTDLTFAVLLLRASPGWWPATTWVVGVPLLGVTTAFARFDLVPGVLAGAALLLVAGRPRVAGVLVALATAVKLWPAVLVPALLAVARPRRSLVVPGAVTGGVLLVVIVALAGWERVVSPLMFQAERGLQMESVGATPAMFAWWLVPGRWTVAYASSRAFEVTGPGVGVLLALTTLATLLYVAGLVLAGRRLWRARDLVDGETLVWWSLVAVTGFVVTGKVLSPQY